LKKWLYNLDDAIATSCLALIILLTGINVISRYVFNSPFAWMQEISLGLFIWTVFIGISSTMKRDGHVGVDYFVVKMPKSLRLISNIIRAIAIIFVLIYIFIVLGFDLINQSSNKLTSVLGINYQIIYLAIPLGGALTAFHFIRKFVCYFKQEFNKKGGK